MCMRQLKETLQMWGVRVKIKDLRTIFYFVKETCSWFPDEGMINPKHWKWVGDAFQDYYRVMGPDKVPVTAFSYWSLINYLLKNLSVSVLAAVAEGQKLLQEKSQFLTQKKI